MKFSYFLFPSLLLFTQLGHAETLSDALLKCANEKNSLKRLVCYDQLSDSYTQYKDVPLSTIQRVQTTQSFEPQPNSNSGNTAQLEPSTSDKEQFGLIKKISAQDKKEKIYYTVSNIQTDRSKRVTLTMEDGQVWYQTDNVSFSVKEGEQVYIQRGSLGSYFLSKDDVKKRIRVKRRK